MTREGFEIPKSTNAGIYMLYNVDKHSAYIGETQNFRARAANHKQHMLNNTHSNKNLQIDFNSGCEFIFVILEDIGQNYEKCELLLKEKQYIYAFRDKSIKTYNYETTEQIEYNLFYEMVRPTISKIQSDFHKNFGCPIPTLERCNTSTLKEKFKESAE